MKILAFVAALAALAFTAAPVFADQSLSDLEILEQQCPSILSDLRIVRPERIVAIGPENKVVVHEICKDLHMTTFGNAGGLRHKIGENKYLVAALAHEGFTADEVVGVDFGANDSVHLYVHHQV